MHVTSDLSCPASQHIWVICQTPSMGAVTILGQENIHQPDKLCQTFIRARFTSSGQEEAFLVRPVDSSLRVARCTIVHARKDVFINSYCIHWVERLLAAERVMPCSRQRYRNRCRHEGFWVEENTSDLIRRTMLRLKQIEIITPVCVHNNEWF